MAEETQEGQKTVVSFVVGLLIGGLLVWAFSGPADDHGREDETTRATSSVEVQDENTDEATDTEATTEATTTPAPQLQVGDGEIVVSNQSAGRSVVLTSATYPVSEGWIGVRDFQNDQLGGLLGVVRFSEAQGLVPSEIILQRPTTAGNEYAVVIYQEDGDLAFNIVSDVQIDTIYSTFTAE